MLELLDISTKTVPNVNWGGGAYFIQAWDAFIAYGSKIQKVFMDGTTKVISPSFGIPIGGRVRGRAVAFPSWEVSAWPINEITGLYDNNQNLLPPGSPIPRSAGDFIDDEADIYIHRNIRDLDFYHISDGVKYATMPALFTYPEQITKISWAGPGKILVAEGYWTGKILLLDYFKREILWGSKVSLPGQGQGPSIVYNPNHDVIVAIGTDNKVRIYSLTVLPASLSTPELYPTAAHVHCLEGRTVRTRLTGDVGEPCPDWWISWELLGAPPKGALEKGVSKTDADGYAWNFWFTPADPGDTGSETIKVSLEV